MVSLSVLAYGLKNYSYSRCGADQMNHEIMTIEKAAMERWRNGDPMGFVESSGGVDIILRGPRVWSNQSLDWKNTAIICNK